MKNTNLIVRVGGGFMDLNEYLRQQTKSECLNIRMQMEKNQLTYQEVVVQILQQRKASEKIINKFVRDSNRIPIPFT